MPQGYKEPHMIRAPCDVYVAQRPLTLSSVLNPELAQGPTSVSPGHVVEVGDGVDYEDVDQARGEQDVADAAHGADSQVLWTHVRKEGLAHAHMRVCCVCKRERARCHAQKKKGNSSSVKMSRSRKTMTWG